MSFNIIGTGSALPNLVVTNDDLAQFLDTNDEWISSRTGIKERHIISDETLFDLAKIAGQSALVDAKVSATEIDMVIVSTLQGEYISPSLSCLIAAELGITCEYLFDINMACSGFIYALDLADTYMKAGKATKILVICAEEMSKLVDWKDRSTCILFGDGAGAVVLEQGNSLEALKLKNSGSAQFLNVSACAGNNPFCKREKNEAYLKMDGQEIFMFAVTSIIEDIRNILQATHHNADDVSHYLLHQANMRILQTAQKRLKLSEVNFPHNMEHCGNTSSASIPILLDELNKSGKLHCGERLLFSSFGAGLTSAAALIKWSKN